ncbi:MAG: site-specific integrase [Magnetospirillum sp.]|nr:site-specific integrase [Magnetospirillum sp.]
MATIWERGPYQFCARVRRNGVSETKTFETKSAAEEWARIIEGKVTGDEFQDRSLARDTTLSQACQWLANTMPDTPDAKNKRSKLRYWQESEFATWSLLSLRPADLIGWRREVLDEDGGGDEADCSAQTVIHRLNVLSQVYKRWSLAHDQIITNPVTDGVRPRTPHGRDRRLGEGEEWRLLNVCRASSRSWLRPAVVIALETCMRQSELAGLTWERVKLDVEDPYADLLKTKNDRARRVPLSPRAVAAFRLLKPQKAGQVFPVETGRGIAHAFRDAVTEQDFPNLRWHDLRHEGTSRQFEHTDLRDHEIMAITGHLRPEMLTRYTHLRADRLAARLRGGKLNRPGKRRP